MFVRGRVVKAIFYRTSSSIADGQGQGRNPQQREQGALPLQEAGKSQRTAFDSVGSEHDVCRVVCWKVVPALGSY